MDLLLATLKDLAADMADMNTELQQGLGSLCCDAEVTETGFCTACWEHA